MQELQYELDSTVCAVAIATPVSLSESEGEEEVVVVIADSCPTPQWTDDSHTASLTNTLTALSLAGVLVPNTSINEVLESLRRVVIVTATPAEAEIEFTMRPRNFLRPCVVEVSTRSGDNDIFENQLPGPPRTCSASGRLEMVMLSIHVGTVTLVLAIKDAEET